MDERLECPLRLSHYLYSAASVTSIASVLGSVRRIVQCPSTRAYTTTCGESTVPRRMDEHIIFIWSKSTFQPPSIIIS